MFVHSHRLLAKDSIAGIKLFWESKLLWFDLNFCIYTADRNSDKNNQEYFQLQSIAILI